jgi:hypothetical protein
MVFASRPRNAILPDSVAGDAAIEAPFIFKKIIIIISLLRLITVAVVKKVLINDGWPQGKNLWTLQR